MASAAAAAKIGYPELQDQLIDPTIADTVLTEADLVRQESYVEWQVDAARAPLPSYLSKAVPSFAGRGTATGFISDGTRGLPKYVESAAFATDGWEALVDATAEWFADTHDASPTVDRYESDRVAWHVPAGDGLVDAVRLDRVEDVVAVTVVGGETAGLGPRNAVHRYGSAVRNRARLR